MTLNDRIKGRKKREHCMRMTNRVGDRMIRETSSLVVNEHPNLCSRIYALTGTDLFILLLITRETGEEDDDGVVHLVL